MKKDLISVVVPIYGVEKYLEKSVASIQAQTYQNLEIILVDDGGRDRCPEICEELAAQDSRIKVIHKENGGLSDARNAGTKLATGDYIVYVDSDDTIAEDMIETLYQALIDGNAEIAVCNYLVVDEDGKPIDERNEILPIIDEVITGKQAIERLCGPVYQYYVTAWNRIYKAEVAKGVIFPKGKIHEDEFSAHEFYALANRVACVSKPLYYYVVRGDSIMTKKYAKKNLSYFEALANRIDYCAGHGVDSVVVPFLNWMVKDLLQTKKKLDMSEEGAREAYLACCESYFALYEKYKSRYNLPLKNTVATMMLKVTK